MNRTTTEAVPEYLRSIATERLRELFDGVYEVHLTDFPDYANVGDSVLTLGLLSFFRQERIKVRAVDFTETMRIDQAVAWAESAPGRAIVVNGGGNLGDLYPHHQEHREAILAAATSATLIIQAPQSGHFQSSGALGRYQQALTASRAEARVGARDRETEAMIPSTARCMLVPDTAHVLGMLEAAPSTRRVVRLLRADVERDPSMDGDLGDAASDWAPDTRFTEFQMRVERKLARESLTRNFRGGSVRWRALARRRLGAGAALLSLGEVIITDRLHAMIMGIHLGRRVVYLDNTTNKLTSYVGAWFPESAGEVARRAATRAEAEEIAREW